ncbi:MAG: hypothetical protein ACUVQP_05215 [Bacteroidales bacterium]
MKIRFLLLTFIIVSTSFAQRQIFTKSITKNFEVNPQTNFSLTNFNGDIDIELWTKNEVEINVIYEVNTVKYKKSDIYMKAFSIEVDKDSTNNLRVSSVIDRTYLDNSFKNGRSYYKINYHLKIPVYLNTSIRNKYGDIHLPELSGSVYVKLSYGKLIIANLAADESKKMPLFDLRYASMTVNKANWLNIDAEYSVIKVKETKAITISSSYSDITIDDVYSATLKSKYDKIDFANISKLNINMNYSKLNIKFLKSDLQCIANYSPFTIQNLYENFSNIWLDLHYSDATVYINKLACFNINTDIDYGKIFLPKRSNVNNYISPTSYKTTGTIGCISGATVNFIAKAEYCDINIIEH